MTTMTKQTEQGAAERAAFEATFSAPPHSLRMERYGRRAELVGQYKSFQTELAWDGYQAGRAAPCAAEAAPEQDAEAAIYQLLMDLTDVDTYDVNLRDHPQAWAAVEKFLAARTANPTPEGCGWTDVAQALPEPQKPVLLDIGRRYPIRAMWVEAKTLPVGGADDDDFGEYAEDDDEWYCPAGWYEWNEHEERHWSVSAKPLRWLDLPATSHPTPKE